MISGMSCSMTISDAPVASRTRAAAAPALRSRAARCPRTARRATGRSGSCAMTHARSTMRRLPVDSSEMSLSRNAPRPHQVDQLVDVLVDAALGCGDPGQIQHRGNRVGDRDVTRERERDRVLDGQRREQPRVLERPARGRARRGGRGRVGHVGAAEHDRAGVGLQEARDQVEQRGLTRAVGADDPEDLALAQVEGDVVDRGDAAEGAGEAAPRAPSSDCATLRRRAGFLSCR